MSCYYVQYHWIISVCKSLPYNSPIFLLCLANKLRFYAKFQYNEKALMEKTFSARKDTFSIKVIWDIQAV